MDRSEPGAPDAAAALAALARRYLWWERGDLGAVSPRRVLAQLMDIGDYDDVLAALSLVGEAAFRDVLANASPGWFRPRSWSYWHLRLGLREPGEPSPPLPVRRVE